MAMFRKKANFFQKREKNKLAFAAFACRDKEGLNLLKNRIQQERIKETSLQSKLFKGETVSIIDQDGHKILLVWQSQSQ